MLSTMAGHSMRRCQRRVYVRVFMQVSRGSPAEEAGMRVGDKCVRFGSLEASNSRGLGELPGIVQNSVGRALRVVVRRGSGDNAEVVALSLTPHTWSGRGLLGCHVSPVG